MIYAAQDKVSHMVFIWVLWFSNTHISHPPPEILTGL